MTTFNTTEPVIETTHGRVRGKLRTTVYDDQFYCFDGIPYARPPLGELRFKSPQPVEPWEGVLDCTEVAQKCLQYNRYTDQNEGSENCLFVNVYAKKLQSEKPLPVMVYLHGGGFNTGDATRLSWGPDYFMMKDVLLITIGYRMGALGFLSLNDPEVQVPGNAGLKDQIMALKWIKRNCLNFNGNPENITLFGHSSGSGSVHFLMLSEQCKGLFHKAILMAGYCFNMPQVANLEYRLAEHIGYEGPNVDKKIYEFLSHVDAEKLVGFKFWTQEESDNGYHYAFMARVEPYVTDDAVVTEEPIELLRQSWGNSIPIMLGGTSFEGLIQYKYYTNNPDLYELYKQHMEYLLPRELQYKCDIAMQKKLAQKLKDFHFGEKELCVENAYCAMDILSYGLVYHPVHRIVKSRLMHSLAPTFLYRFDFDSPTFNLYRIKHCGPDVRGAGHVDELSYIFYMATSFKLELNSPEFLTIRRMVDMWTQFAASSDPNTSLVKPAAWKPVERFGPLKCLNISHDLSFIDFPESEKCSQWDSLYEEAAVKLF